MKKLTDLFLFEMMDKKSDIKNKLLGVNLSLDKLKLDALDESFRVINRRFNYGMKSKVMNEVMATHVIPLYNKDRLFLPKAVPAWLFSLGGNPVALVNLTNDGRYSDKIFDIDNRTLFAHLQTGTILRECYFNWNKICMNSEITKNATIAYTKLFSKVLDKMYGITLNKQRVDCINYVIAKFFLHYQLEKAESDVTNNTAYLTCFNDTTKVTVSNADAEFPDEAYSNIDMFVQALATMDGLSKLTMRSFLEQWMVMYGDSTVLALEYFPFFCSMIFSSMIAAHVNKEFAIESVVNKETLLIYNEMARILR